MPFLLIFILLPIIEIAVFIAVGDRIGLGWTLVSALGTAIFGGAVISHQGMQVTRVASQSIARGAMPGKEIFDGICLVAAGATLITPGFVTDAIGLLLLVPFFRMGLRSFVTARLKVQNFGEDGFEMRQSQHRAPQDSDVIEGDFVDISQNDDDTKP